MFSHVPHRRHTREGDEKKRKKSGGAVICCGRIFKDWVCREPEKTCPTQTTHDVSEADGVYTAGARETRIPVGSLLPNHDIFLSNQEGSPGSEREGQRERRIHSVRDGVLSELTRLQSSQRLQKQNHRLTGRFGDLHLILVVTLRHEKQKALCCRAQKKNRRGAISTAQSIIPWVFSLHAKPLFYFYFFIFTRHSRRRQQKATQPTGTEEEQERGGEPSASRNYKHLGVCCREQVLRSTGETHRHIGAGRQRSAVGCFAVSTTAVCSRTVPHHLLLR